MACGACFPASPITRNSTAEFRRTSAPTHKHAIFSRELRIAKTMRIQGKKNPLENHFCPLDTARSFRDGLAHRVAASSRLDRDLQAVDGRLAESVGALDAHEIPPRLVEAVSGHRITILGVLVDVGVGSHADSGTAVAEVPFFPAVGRGRWRTSGP